VKVNAAPTLGEAEGQESIEPKSARPDLVSILRDQFGPPPVPDAKSLGKRKDDYEKFIDEMSDILG
jgi:WW domain-binding protein 11